MHLKAASLLTLSLCSCVVTIPKESGTGGSGASARAGSSAAARGGSNVVVANGGRSGNQARAGQGGSTGKPTPAAAGGSSGQPTPAAEGGRGGARSEGGAGGALSMRDAGQPDPTGSITPPCFACRMDSTIACEDDPPAASSSNRATALAAKLGKAHFLIGMGNDLDNDHTKDGAYTLGTRLDLHYAYLVGLPGMGGWPEWNENGTFVNILADTAGDQCVTPMYTVYSMAAWGDGNLAGLGDGSFMSAYWSAAKLLFERLGVFDRPSVVHIEPDFWAYAAQQSGQNPAAMRVLIHGLAADCQDEPENLIGMGYCWIKLARKYAPKALIGFHASQWASSPGEIISFFQAVGSADMDMIIMDMLDRDAGCFEAAQDPGCQRQGEFYWDESNQKSPNFHEYFSYAKTVSDGLDKPILWWQIPFGVPSDQPGGTAGHYRDNRVNYIFGHIDELVAAGGVGAAFGTGAGNQTTWLSDGDRFKQSVEKYFQAPTWLP
jgi:hypothetical protein